MGVDIQFEGMNELIDKVQELGRKGSSIQNAALKAAAQPVVEDMRNIVAVSDINEKHIKDDIQVSNVKIENGRKYVRVGPGKDTNWRAKFLEFGTSKMSAKPFMAPAYENNKEKSKQIIKEELKEGLGL
ncbi:HK97-gp10 family putative phage morphogenesis protein [Clostridium sp. WILCCON 0269]|uniref:HK97-gp10 family putative phage morphogenesis protein n=1 Tax=Candidatus Clostridium eludens TaxID=3381663 RepID=A0ABW8SLT1_9CLOT